MSTVEVYRSSKLSAEEVLGFGFAHVAVATGAHWRRDGVARFHTLPIPIASDMPVFTPDELMRDRCHRAVSCSMTMTIITWGACWPSCWWRGGAASPI